VIGSLGSRNGVLFRCHAVVTREVGTGAEHRDDAGVRIDDGVACGEDLRDLKPRQRPGAYMSDGITL
jgi:hypothetical protein